MDARPPKALTGRFALLCGAIIVAIGAMLFYGYRASSFSDLRTMAERNNVALTRAFANAIWPEFRAFVATAHTMDAEILRAHPRTAALRRATLGQMDGVAVVKVKIYDLNGLTVFSTEPRQIGEIKSGNAGYLSARQGHVVSEFSHRDTFSAFEQEIADRDLLSSYIPLSGPDGRTEGVFEIYYDLTGLVAQVDGTTRRQSLIVVGCLALLYLLVILALYQRDRTVARQHRQNIRLATLAATADEQNRLKSEFLANMSHELRTPLNAILGFSESMRNEIFGPMGSERYRSYADDIWKSGKHLVSIVDDVLDMSRIEAGSLEIENYTVNVKEVFYDCIRMMAPLAHKKSIQIKAMVPSSTPDLRGDERRISQALLNVLSNAVKFSGEGGAIEVSARVDDSGRLAITVSDFGCGIEPEQIPHILLPFGQSDGAYTRDQGGVGLGLPIARSIAELHGGELTMSSRPGIGTTVRLIFPPERVIRRTPEAEAAAAPKSVARAPAETEAAAVPPTASEAATAADATDETATDTPQRSPAEAAA